MRGKRQFVEIVPLGASGAPAGATAPDRTYGQINLEADDNIGKQIDVQGCKRSNSALGGILPVVIYWLRKGRNPIP